jgi:hypothetical protein
VEKSVMIIPWVEVSKLIGTNDVHLEQIDMMTPAAVSKVMALWRSWLKADGTRGLLYRNFSTRTQFTCGVVLASTPEVELIEWVFTQGNVTPWDVISFDTGTVVAFMPSGARA